MIIFCIFILALCIYDDWVNLYMELYILLFKENMTCKDSNEEFKYIL